MSWIKKERDEFINEYERKYGVRISEKDEMLPIMHYIYTAGLESVCKLREVEQLVKKVEKSLDQLRTSGPHINLQHGEGWGWQVGMGVRYALILLAVSVAISILVFVSNWTSIQRSEASFIIEAAPHIQRDLLRNIEVDNDGDHFLHLMPNRDTILNDFPEYILLKDSSVRVYLDLAR
jgi:hypothetical protein